MLRTKSKINATSRKTKLTRPQSTSCSHRLVRFERDHFGFDLILLLVCHEAVQEMRVWPLGVGLQEQASNHLKLQRERAFVVSVEEKSRHKTVAGEDQGDERERTADEVSKTSGSIKTGG